MEAIEEEVELVSTHCTHKDCYYRMKTATNLEWCGYCYIESMARRCPISKCDKYKPKKRMVEMVEIHIPKFREVEDE